MIPIAKWGSVLRCIAAAGDAGIPERSRSRAIEQRWGLQWSERLLRDSSRAGIAGLIRLIPLIGRSVTLISALLLSAGCMGTAGTVPASMKSPQLPGACGGGWTAPFTRPVSTTTVSAWYVSDGKLIYIVFVRGAPGWWETKTQWTMGTDSVGRFVQTFDVGGFRYNVTLDDRAELLTVHGSTTRLDEGRVVLAERVRDSLVVRRVEQAELCWPLQPDMEVMIGQVLGRAPAALQFVSDTPNQ